MTTEDVRSTFKQHCVRQRKNLQGWTASNQRYLFRGWFEQLCNFQRRFPHVGEDWNKVVNMTIWKNQKNKLRAKNIIILSFKWKSFKLNTLKANVSSLYYPFQGIYVEEYLQTVKILKTLWICCITKAIFKPFHFAKHEFLFNFTRGLVDM